MRFCPEINPQLLLYDRKKPCGPSIMTHSEDTSSKLKVPLGLLASYLIRAICKSLQHQVILQRQLVVS